MRDWVKLTIVVFSANLICHIDLYKFVTEFVLVKCVNQLGCAVAQLVLNINSVQELLVSDLLDQLHVHDIVDRLFTMQNNIVYCADDGLNIFARVVFHMVHLLCNRCWFLLLPFRVPLNQQLYIWISISGCRRQQRDSLFAQSRMYAHGSLFGHRTLDGFEVNN